MAWALLLTACPDSFRGTLNILLALVVVVEAVAVVFLLFGLSLLLVLTLLLKEELGGGGSDAFDASVLGAKAVATSFIGINIATALWDLLVPVALVLVLAVAVLAVVELLLWAFLCDDRPEVRTATPWALDMTDLVASS
jgi:hypothetical protein